jgi:hypothetical protein
LIFIVKKLSIILSVIAVVALILRESFEADKIYKDSIPDSVENRRSLKADWNGFYSFYFKLGLQRVEIDAVKHVVQKHS